MNEIQMLLALLVATLSFCVAAESWKQARVRRYRWMKHNLDAAAEAAELHYSAVERLMGEPVLSDEAKILVSGFSHYLPDHTFAQFMAAPTEGAPSGNADSVVQEVLALRDTRPDIVELFFTAMKTGVLSAMLRWPDTAKHVEIFSEIAADRRKEKKITRDVGRYTTLHPAVTRIPNGHSAVAC